MDSLEGLDEFNIDGGTVNNNALYTIPPREKSHSTHNKHHARDKPTGGSRPDNNPDSLTSRDNARAAHESSVRSPPSAQALDGTVDGGKGKRGKKCSCCKKATCVCHTGKCKSCGKTGGDCGCMGGQPLAVTGGRARSKSKTRAKSKGKRAKSKGKK